MAEITVPQRLARILEKDGGTSTKSGDNVSGSATGTVDDRLARRGEGFIDILPVNLVTNGGFDADSDWTLQGSTAITGGVLHIQADAGQGALQAVAGFEIGQTYRTSFDLVELTSSSVSALIRNSANTVSVATIANAQTAIQSYTVDFVATETTHIFRFLVNNTGGNAKVDNASVIKVS